jgi:hypothetical protein
VIGEPALRGYLLEETLAWLLRSSAYDLLVSADQDPAELVANGNELRVRGRGTTHQVDVLGQFAYTPAFSLPVRLFLEAKFHARPCRIDEVRNALGVIEDVNQNYTTDPDSSRPRRRFQYCYSLFSTSGFSDDAQDFAIAHQISLIDLSGESFEGLRMAVYTAAHELREAAREHRVRAFPLTWTRRTLRLILGTADQIQVPEVSSNAPVFLSQAEASLGRLANALHKHAAVELLLGFPTAPFIVTLATENRQSFMRYAALHPSHRVHLRRRGQGDHAEWSITPYEEPGIYDLHFVLPRRLESWISENETYRRLRTSTIKSDFLSAIMIYYLDDGIRACQLYYEPGQLRRG